MYIAHKRETNDKEKLALSEYFFGTENFNNEEKVANLKYLAFKNWDMSMIIKTNIQISESTSSGKLPQNIKLYNTVNSAIIFDVVQMLTMEYIKPCVAAMERYIKKAPTFIVGVLYNITKHISIHCEDITT